MFRWLASVRCGLLILVLLAIFPAIGLSLYNAGEQRRQGAADAHQEALTLIRLVSAEQEQIVRETRHLLSFLARQPEVQTGDPSTCSKYLADVLEEYPLYTGIGVADLSGDVYCRALPSREQVNVAGLPHFQGALQSREFTIGDYQIGRISGKAVLLFGHPVFDPDGNLKGVVIVGLDLNWLNDFISRTELPSGSALTVADMDGTVLARHPNPEVWIGESIEELTPFQQTLAAAGEGTGEGIGLDGVPKLYAFTRLGQRDLAGEIYVSIGIPESVAYAPANQSLQRHLIGLGVALALTLGIAWFGTDLLVMRRMKALVTATQRLALGDFKSRSGFKIGSGEFGTLEQAFSRMAQGLEEREEERAERIREQARRAEAEAARERITSILESINDAFFAVDRDWRFTYLNSNAGQVMQQLTGKTVDELIGQDMWEELSQFLGSRFYEEYHRAVAEQASVQFEEFCPQLKVWLEVHAHPSADGLSIFFQDITERKRMEEALRKSEAELTDFVETATLGLHRVGPDGIIQWANRAELQMLGYEPDEYIGHYISEFHADQSAIEDILQRLSNGETLQNYQAQLRAKDGSLRHVLIDSTVFWENGEFKYTRCFMRDETQRRRAEAQAQQESHLTSVLNRVGATVVSELDLQQVVQKVTDEATDLTGAQFGSFFYNVQNEEGESYMLHTLSGAPREAFERFPQPRNTAVFAPTFRGEGVIRLDDVTQDPRYGQTPPWYGMPPGHLTVRSYLAVPVLSRNGEVLGGLFFGHEQPGRFTEYHEHVLNGIVSWAAIAIENAQLYTARRHAEAALRESEAQLAAELGAMLQLQGVSTQLIPENKSEALYQQILDAAIELMCSGAGSLQLLHPHSNQLQLLAWKGLDPISTAFWEWVTIGSGSTCSVALRTGERVVAPDIETCDFITGTPDLDAYRRSGIRAVQSTPLVSRSGRLLGMISTHWHNPHEPTERDFRLLDVLARQVADLLERTQSEESLREADRRKDQFLAMLSHELRNPLAPIVNAVELLRRGQGDASIQQVALSVLDNQVGTLTRLVDDLLDVSRVTTGRIQLQQVHVDLNALVKSVADSFRPQMAERRHEFLVSHPNTPLWVRGDPMRLEQVVVNLLSNAAKYTPPEGRVWLTIVEEGDEALIRVKDSGIGIEAELLPHIFELFSQGKVTLDRGQSGMGVGLSLVKSLVEMQGGRVTALSEGPGKGSEFAVWLPTVLAPVPQAVTSPEDSTRKADRSLRVLLVDDVEDTRKILGRLLQSCGHQIRTAQDGPTAIEAALEFQPDAVLLDIGMPGMDGYEVARRMRHLPPLAKVALVAITGYGQPTDRQRSREAGFNHHLVKPPDIEAMNQLFAKIAETRTS